MSRIGPTGSRAFFAGAVFLAAATGCGRRPAGPSPEDVGVVELAVMNAPPDATCLRVVATGTRSVTALHDLTQGQSTVFPMTRLPVGEVRFTGDAFAVSCAALTPGEVARWVGDPVTVTITPGVVAQVQLRLVRNGRAQVGVDFEPDPATVFTLDVRVATGSDDAEEFTTDIVGNVGVDLTSSDLELTRDISSTRNQVVGIRFAAVDVPAGATIVAASIQFTAKLDATANPPTSPATTLLNVRAEATDNPATFAATSPNVSARPTTTASVAWGNVPLWPTADAAGPDQRTPSLVPLVQELVDRRGWARGNAMVFVISGTGTRSAHSFNGMAAGAPLLHVEYRMAPPRDGGPDEPPPLPEPPMDTDGNQSYLVPAGVAGVTAVAVLTAGGSPVSGTGPGGGPYRMVGIPDGLGAFDNGDGTYTVLMNHELGATQGVLRAHGARGAFVSRWVVRKSTPPVVERGEDLIRQVVTWNRATGSFNAPATGVALGRLCSADLPPRAALFDAASGLGYDGRLFFSGEEVGSTGRGFAHDMDGTSYELPRHGQMSWENIVLNPATGTRTLSVGLDDSSPGQVYVYLGSKTATGSPIERAGLHNGNLFGVVVAGVPTEAAGSPVASPLPFTLHPFGDVAAIDGTVLESQSNANAVTRFGRPEDGAWDPMNPADFYFVTTSTNRLWRMRFADLGNPAAGGTIVAVVTGRGMVGPDNIAVTRRGEVLIQEDPGMERLAKIWRYRIAGDLLEEVAHANPRFFSPSSPFFLGGINEESSGIIDMTEILGPGFYLTDVMTKVASDAEVVEGGQLQILFVPPPS